MNCSHYIADKAAVQCRRPAAVKVGRRRYCTFHGNKLLARKHKRDALKKTGHLKPLFTAKELREREKDFVSSICDIHYGNSNKGVSLGRGKSLRDVIEMQMKKFNVSVP